MEWWKMTGRKLGEERNKCKQRRVIQGERHPALDTGRAVKACLLENKDY